MSGGFFLYNQRRIEEIADSIDELIASNDDPSRDEWGDRRGRGYSVATLARFRETVQALRLAAAMAQRVDYLVSNDDSEDSFHRRWEKEVLKTAGT